VLVYKKQCSWKFTAQSKLVQWRLGVGGEGLGVKEFFYHLGTLWEDELCIGSVVPRNFHLKHHTP